MFLRPLLWVLGLLAKPSFPLLSLALNAWFRDSSLWPRCYPEHSLLAPSPPLCLILAALPVSPSSCLHSLLTANQASSDTALGMSHLWLPQESPSITDNSAAILAASFSSDFMCEYSAEGWSHQYERACFHALTSPASSLHSSLCGSPLSATGWNRDLLCCLWASSLHCWAHRISLSTLYNKHGHMTCSGQWAMKNWCVTSDVSGILPCLSLLQWLGKETRMTGDVTMPGTQGSATALEGQQVPTVLFTKISPELDLRFLLRAR